MARRCTLPRMPLRPRARRAERCSRSRTATMVRLAPAPAEQVDEIVAGRLYKDGSIVGDIEAIGVPERRRLAFAGHVGVALVLERARRGRAAIPRSCSPACRKLDAPRPPVRGDRARRRPRHARFDPAAAAPRPRGGARGGPPGGPGRGRRGLGQEAGLHRLRRGRMTGVDDRPPQPCRHRRAGHRRRRGALPRQARRDGVRAGCRSPITA